jgi:TonB-linked SusC/RagA family outer membrane protein
MGWVLSQNRILTGKVTDSNGLPVANATIAIKGTKIGTTTAAGGQFSFSVPVSARVLAFSSMNYTSREVSIGSLTHFNVILSSAVQNLEEVVVVGYGTQKKTAFTGAASKVEVKDFANLLTPAVDKQLAGRAAGVQVTTSGGLVNLPATIRIRGINSITQSNDPLVVVDGLPILSGNLAGTTNSNTLGDINPSDIESLDILKDGSATAIYGSRAAAGVILITTKKGAQNGRTSVSYDGFVGVSSALKKFSLLNAKQFETIANEKFTNAAMPVLAGVNAAVDTANTDWQDAVMIKNAVAQSHTLSIRGGGEKTSFYLSFNYSDQKGIIISNYNRAYRVRMNIEHEINKFVKVGNNLSVSRQEDGDQNNGTNALGGAISSTLRLLPNVSPYNPANSTGYNIGYPNNNFVGNGPNLSTVEDNYYNVAFTLRNDKYYSDKYRIINNAFIEIYPVKGLTGRSQVGVDMLNDYSYQGLNLYHGDGYGKGDTYNVDQNWLRLLWTNYFTYQYSLQGHNFSLTAGNEVQKETYKWFAADGTAISDAFYISQNVISNAANTQVIGGNYDQTGFLSYFGRFNYDYQNKYFVQATIRRDGQSALAPGKQYGNFPGFSAGWRASRETFWENSPFLSRWFSEAKLKASYAKVGNTLTGYPYLTTFGNAPYGNINGLAPSGVGNSDLRWETSAKYDVGIELGILKNRFDLTVDWFLNDVDHLVLGVPQPLSAGLVGSYNLNGGTIQQNIGTLQNRGIEIAVNGNVLKSPDFTWNLNVNFSAVQNKITSLYSVGGLPVTNISNGAYNIIRVGDPVNIIYGYRSAGVNTANGNPMWYKADGTLVQLSLQTPVTGNPSTNTAGVFYVANSKTDGTLGAVSSLSAADKSKLGQGVPTWFGGFSNSFQYKGIGLEIMLRYSGGNKIMNVTSQEALYNMSFQNNGTGILNRWTTPGQVTDVPKLFYGQANNINSVGNADSRFVENGNYVRLQNIVLSYTLNGTNLSGLTGGYVKSARFYVQGQNLYAWTKYKGADPDNISSLGVDDAVSPQVRTFSLGVSLGF